MNMKHITITKEWRNMKVLIRIHCGSRNYNSYYILPEFRISTYVDGWSKTISEFIPFTDIITYHHKRMKKYES